MIWMVAIDVFERARLQNRIQHQRRRGKEKGRNGNQGIASNEPTTRMCSTDPPNKRSQSFVNDNNGASSSSSSTASSVTPIITTTFLNTFHRWLAQIHAFRESHPPPLLSSSQQQEQQQSSLLVNNASTTLTTLLPSSTTVIFPLIPSSKLTTFAIVLGQIIALFAASVNASSYALEYHFGVFLPMFQMFGMYLLLSFHLFFLLVPSSRPSVSLSSVSEPRPFLRVPWYLYCGMAWLDVQANYMTLLALRYTSLTSATLLGSLTVPSTMFISRILLRKCFQRHHYVGVLLCLVGGTFTLWSDKSNNTNSNNVGGGTTLLLPSVSSSSPLSSSSTATATTTTTMFLSSHVLWGDVLAMTAAILYGLGDTIAEYSIKHIDRVEYLGMLGLFGAMWTGLAIPWLEGTELRQLWLYVIHNHHHHQAVDDDNNIDDATANSVMATMIWYILSLLAYYVSSSFFLQRSDATLLNLSLQAVNLWSIVVSVVVYRNAPPWVFYVAVLLVVSGVVVYECGGYNGSSKSTDPTSCTRPPCPLSDDDDNTCCGDEDDDGDNDDQLYPLGEADDEPLLHKKMKKTKHPPTLNYNAIDVRIEPGS